jgi:basic membrane lipoprotein Med (substrate-binding protein (PBP1-ABC) superfamily)
MSPQSRFYLKGGRIVKKIVKKITILVLVLLLASIAGCGSGGSDSGSEVLDTDNPTGQEQQEKILKVAFVYPGAKDDFGWATAHEEARKKN